MVDNLSWINNQNTLNNQPNQNNLNNINVNNSNTLITQPFYSIPEKNKLHNSNSKNLLVKTISNNGQMIINSSINQIHINHINTVQPNSGRPSKVFTTDSTISNPFFYPYNGNIINNPHMVPLMVQTGNYYGPGTNLEEYQNQVNDFPTYHNYYPNKNYSGYSGYNIDIQSKNIEEVNNDNANNNSNNNIKGERFSAKKERNTNGLHDGSFRKNNNSNNNSNLNTKRDKISNSNNNIKKVEIKKQQKSDSNSNHMNLIKDLVIDEIPYNNKVVEYISKRELDRKRFKNDFSYYSENNIDHDGKNNINVNNINEVKNTNEIFNNGKPISPIINKDNNMNTSNNLNETKIIISGQHKNSSEKQSRNQSPLTKNINIHKETKNKVYKNGELFKTYTLKDYRELTASKVQMGSLGPNLGGPEWEERARKLKKKEEYSNSLKENKLKLIKVKGSPKEMLEKQILDNVLHSKNHKAYEYSDIVTTQNQVNYKSKQSFNLRNNLNINLNNYHFTDQNKYNGIINQYPNISNIKLNDSSNSNNYGNYNNLNTILETNEK